MADDRTHTGRTPIDATMVDVVAPSGAPAASPCLILVHSAQAASIGKVFRLDREESVLGRSLEAELRVEDPGVSRKHAKVLRRPAGDCLVVDLGSTNGTYVNGLRIRSATLAEGDRIQIGNFAAFRFSLRDQLEKSEEHLRQALAAAGVGTWEWEVATERMTLSDVTERMLGLSPGVQAADFWSLVHPDDRGSLRQGLDRAVDQASPCDLECRFLLSGGGHRWVAMKGEVFRDEAGAPVRAAGALVDVSGRKRAEEELRRQALMFESLSDGVVVLDLDGAILDWNASAERMFGWSKPEALGKMPGELFRPGEPDTLTRAVVEGIAQEGRWSGELALRRKDGGECAVELVAMPLKDSEGRHLANITVHRDVGERRRMQARLQLADRMASLGTLAAGMAHEINNPLSFVSANLTFAAEEIARLEAELGPRRLVELAAALRETKHGVERIGALVRDLKIVSRDADPEVPTPVDVNDVLRFVVRVADNQIRHRARLVTSYGEIPRVLASESRLGQVLLNLVINAAQAIPEGSAAQNEIRVASRAGPSGSLVVEVADTGSGIAPENLGRIFDPFFTTKPVGSGTGLGLSICHNIVSSLGGEISVESAPGKGSRFRVTLPAARAAPSASAAPPRRPAGGRARILVVDDEPLVSSAIRRCLGRQHEVTALGQAAEALALLASGAEFDVILCDVMMPDMTGMDLHARLREAAPGQAARMVFMTGGAFTDRAQKFLESSGNQRLAKPLDFPELGHVIGQLLQARG